MSMFNWQASANDPVLSSRFWVYWAVTVPLTLLVLAVWLFWLRQHKTREETSGLRSKKSEEKKSGIWDQLRGLRRRKRISTVDNEAVSDIDMDNLQSNAEDAIPSAPAPSARVDTLIQGPRR